MSSKSSCDDLGESWVDVTAVTGGSIGSQSHSGGGGFGNTTGTATPSSITQQLSVEDYLRLLREAQRESNHSSARVSLAGSRRDTPRSSPKSPPNSPIVQGTPLNLEWQSYYINKEIKDGQEFFADWSSRPDQLPPKTWCFRPVKTDMLSIRYARIGSTSVFSRRGLYTLFITNLLSLLLGTGIGLWLSKQDYFASAIVIR